mgnify:CR=1 FL=1
MRADRRAQSARPRGVRHANSLRVSRGGACPLFLTRYGKTSLVYRGRGVEIPYGYEGSALVVTGSCLASWELSCYFVEMIRVPRNILEVEDALLGQPALASPTVEGERRP